MLNLNNNYRSQNGCWDCKHCFTKQDYNSCDEHFCTYKAEPRPICGSSITREGWKLSDFDEFEKQMYKWDEWCEGKCVTKIGICDKWGKLSQGGYYGMRYTRSS